MCIRDSFQLVLELLILLRPLILIYEPIEKAADVRRYLIEKILHRRKNSACLSCALRKRSAAVSRYEQENKDDDDDDRYDQRFVPEYVHDQSAFLAAGRGRDSAADASAHR